MAESRRSLSKPDRGIVKTLIEGINQGGLLALRATAINFVLVRPAPAADHPPERGTLVPWPATRRGG